MTETPIPDLSAAEAETAASISVVGTRLMLIAAPLFLIFAVAGAATV
jgi:hypothetical protein